MDFTLDHGPRWLAPLLVAIAIVALVYGCALWWPRTVDDACITFHYAQNVVDGHGPVYNPGERVEGYSSPSWMAAMALAIAVGIDPVPASKWLGAGCAVALVLLLYAGVRRSGAVDWGAGTVAILLGSSLVLQIWSVSGLETNAFALLLFAGLLQLSREVPTSRAVLCASLLLTAAALTRPEGLAFWVAGFVPVIVWSSAARERGSGASRLRRVGLYAAPGLLLIAHLLWRLAYYGAPLPNTYYVKTGGGIAMWLQGLHGLGSFVSEPFHLFWILAALAGALVAASSRSRHRALALMGGATLLHLAWVVSVGDDGLRIHRFYVPVLAPLAFLVGELFARRARGGWFVGAGVVALTAAASIWTLSTDLVPLMRQGALPYQEGNARLGRYLAETDEPYDLIAVAAAGAIPYHSRLPTLDMYGLNDTHIARQPFPEDPRGRLMKWDSAYVLSRGPDLIAINRGYFRPGDPVASRVARQPRILAHAPMEKDLFERIAQDGSYALRPIKFQDGAVFYVFERKDRRESVAEPKGSR